VGFLSRAADEVGAHAAVLTYTDSTGIFPPNTLFRLREVCAPGTWKAPGGTFPQQRLLIVTATYLLPSSDDESSYAGKLCSSTNALRFGCRNAYVHGIDRLLAKPLLTMELECTRNITWTDFNGYSYSIADEWAYVNGMAKSQVGCTPGTRDANNDGKTVEDFLRLANTFVAERRAAGIGKSLPESHAFLTRDDVLAVRLYSGPAYQPINNWLRQVDSVDEGLREQLAQQTEGSFTSTVRQLCTAIRKLAAVAPTGNEAITTLYRGVRGELPDSFFDKDRMGLLVAVDLAFMSTSKNEETSVKYMAKGGKNVMWRLQPQSPSDSAFHQGADISMFSQFADEDEILFPPMCMLQVLKEAERYREETRRTVGSTEYRVIDVLPSFL